MQTGKNLLHYHLTEKSGEGGMGVVCGQTPKQIEHLIRRCLERNPARRLRDLGEARILLEDVLSGRADPPQSDDGAPPVAAADKGRFVWMALALASIVAMLAMAAVTLRPGSTPRASLVQSTVMPPDDWDFAPSSPFAVSPDGGRIASMARPRPDSEGVLAGSIGLWIHDLSKG